MLWWGLVLLAACTPTSAWIPEFALPAELLDAGLNCTQVIRNPVRSGYTRQRVTYQDSPLLDGLPTTCRDIRRRHWFPRDALYPKETIFPLAFVRIVYKDYRFLEQELATSYAPQNVYCYAVDAKASKVFHARMNALAACLPNVHLTREEFPMNSYGHNVTRSALKCLDVLRRHSWRYVFMLQNHDVQIKTNQELVRILRLYNGTNDVQTFRQSVKRIQPGVNWSFKWLKLFKESGRNIKTNRDQPPFLKFAKSLFQVTWSREAIDYIFEELNIQRLLSKIEWKAFGVDETMWSTLNSNDALDVPGGYTLECLRKGVEDRHFTRFSVWWDDGHCRSKVERHYLCIFGAEDIEPNIMDDNPHFFANKFLASVDWGAISCWHQVLYNRTHFERGVNRIRREIYENIPQVKFNRQRRETNNFKAKHFSCG